MTGSHRTLTRSRYVAVRIDSESSFESRDLFEAVWASILRLFGEFGASQTGLFLIEFNPQMEGAILGAPLPVGQSLLLAWPQMTGMIAGTILLFVVAYVLFQRQEIRA